MSWDDVELDFGGEETANFGPRQESGTALFQVDTLATISPRGEVICNPVLNAACGAEGFCVAAGRQISLFDETCHEFSVTISFDSDVDKIAWSDDSMFVVVAETSGVINFVDVGLKMQLFSQSLVKRDENDNTKCFKQMMFIPGKKTGVFELLVLASNGSLFRFSNVNLDKLNQAIEEKDFKLAKQIQGEIALEQTDVGYLHTDGANFFTTAFWEGSTHIVTCGKGNSVAAIWKCGKNGTTLVRTLSNDLFGDAGVVQCRVSTNGKWLFLLDEEHTLSVFDPRSLIMIDYWPEVEMQEFIIMNYSSVNTGNKNSNAREPELQMVVLTPGPDFYLKVFTLPGMECTYSLAISKYCKLAEVIPSQEGIFLLEGIFEEYLSDTISTLRVRCLTEALPETRFKRLLNKKKFEEAEKFAVQFNLDVELVYRVKAADLLEKLSPWSKHQPEDILSLYKEVTECLDRISDITFVVDVCAYASMPTQELMYDVLKYAKERLQKVDSTQDSKGELATKVLHVTHRLETFQMVYSNNAYSAEQWDIFLRADMLEELNKWLTFGQLTEADIIWKRHKPEFEASINEAILHQLLTAIPENMKSEEITMWLQQDIIPFVNHRFPAGKKPLAQWMTEKAKNMETSEKTDWPQNSLKFAELFFAKNQDTRLSPEEYTTELTSKTTYTAGASELWELVQKLRKLQHLKTKYKCKMSLAEYDRETISSIVFRMLDRVVAPELVPSTIEQVIRPYMKENNLNEDKLLLQYIEDLLEHTGKQNAYSYESSWEAKSIAVIRCMNDMECHIDGIYTVMSFATPPWSPVLENLIQSGMALQHPKVANLKERCEVLQLRKVLCKYGLIQHNVLDKTNAQTVMKFIIIQDKPDSLPDALRVVKAYNHMSPADAYLFHIKFLIKRNRLQECLDILKALPKTEAKLYCRKTIIWAKDTLESPVSSVQQECMEETGLITQGALTMLHFLLAGTDESYDRIEWEEWTALKVDLKNILALQTEFGEFLSVDRFRDADARKSLLTQYLVKFYTNQDITSSIETTLGSERKSRQNDSKKNFNKILRLGELLKFSTNEIQGQLAIKAAKTGEVETAMRFARKLSSQVVDKGVAKILFVIAHSICELWSAGKTKHMTSEYMADVQDMARKAAANCDDDLLIDCVELCKHLSLASQVYHQCESGDYGITVKTTTSASTSKDPYNDWIMDDFFKEDTLVMDSATVLPMVYQFTMACMPASDGDQGGQNIGRKQFIETEPEVKEEDTEDNKSFAIPSSSQSYIDIASCTTMPLIQHLQENNQYELALKVLLVGLDACLRHFVANTCCLELCNKKQAEKEQQLVKDVGNMSVERLKMFTTNILMKICGSRRVDEKLGLAYTCIMAKRTALDKLNALVASAGQNYRKLLAVAIIGEAYAFLTKETEVLEYCSKLITSAKWGKRLSKLKISNMRDVFSTTSIQNKHHILPYLVKQPVVDVKLIREYCRAFDILEVNEALLNHLDMLLLPDTHSPDAQGVVVEINKAAIDNVLASITDSDLKVQKLIETIDKVNPYDYERLIFIMETITEIRGKEQTLDTIDLGLKILCNLMDYTRKSEPSQYELDFLCTTEEEQLRGITGRLSPLAKTRLPYHPLIKGGQWKILTPELNEDTVEKLMLICNLLKLPADHVYVVVINNIMSRYKDQAAPRSVGDSSSKSGVIDLKALENVQKLLLRIENTDMAIATARVVAKAIPLGKEKVLSLKACEMLARHARDKCVAENSEEKKKAHILHQKLSSAYRAVATEQILRQHQLASPNLLALVETPARLIFTLFEHPSVQKRRPGTQQDLPDIHAAANEIASVNKVDILKICNKLVEMWLPHPSANKQSEEDVTMNMNISLVTLDESSHNEEEKSLKRVIYVMQSRDIESSARFLLNYAYKVESEHITNACRVRALRCLFTLFDAEEIEKLADKPIKDIREYMKNLLYLCKLSHLNISMDLPSFVNVDKEGLVRGLWRNHSRNQKAVRLVADLCIDYKIHDAQLWNSILIQLISFNMMDFLRHVLSSLSALPHLWQIECLPRAWRSVLLAPFIAVCAPLTEDQEDKCRESAVFLQSCPMAMSLDLMSLCKQYMKVEMYAEALGCLLYIPEQDKKHNQIKSLLDCNCHVAILDEISKVEKSGKQMPQMEKIQAAVFDHLSQSDSYQTLQGTKHLETMVKYFVKTKNIKGLLRKALMSKRVNEAVEIVNMYTGMHPDTPSVHDTLINPASGIHKLRTYLKIYKHEDLLQYVPKETRQYHSESTG